MTSTGVTSTVVTSTVVTSTVGRHDVVVIGGGVIGLAIAWRSAQAGLSVAVADDAPGAGASYAAAGMLAPVAEVAYGEDALLGLARASLAGYPAFVAELEQAAGRSVGLRTAGTLVIGFDSDDMRALQDLHRFQHELGLPAEAMGPRECRRLEPALTPRLRGGVHMPGDHSVDGRELHAALLVACRRAGVQLVPQRVVEIRVEAGRTSGVHLGDGVDLGADSVVVAMGAQSAGLPRLLPGLLPGLAPGAVPVRPVKGQILRLHGAAPLLEGTVRALVRGRHVYLVPYGQTGVIVGATVEEMGFDPTVTAGAVFELLRDAIEVVPGLSECALTETLARWRPGTPDNAPLLGPCAIPGLVLATGHYRNGILLAPVTADVISRLLVTGELPDIAADFAAARFSRSEVAHAGHGQR